MSLLPQSIHGSPAGWRRHCLKSWLRDCWGSWSLFCLCLEEEPGRLQSMGSLSRTRLSNFTFTFHFQVLEKEMATHSSAFAWRIPGSGGPGGLLSMGSRRVVHDWSYLALAAAPSCPQLCAGDRQDYVKAFSSYREVEEAKQGRYPQRGASAWYLWGCLE